IWFLVADVGKDLAARAITKYFGQANHLKQFILWMLDHPWQVSLYFSIQWALILTYLYLRSETSDSAATSVGSTLSINVVFGDQNIHDNLLISTPITITTSGDGETRIPLNNIYPMKLTLPNGVEVQNIRRSPRWIEWRGSHVSFFAEPNLLVVDDN